MIDTHCHLTQARFADDLPAVIDRARTAGMSAAITIATGIEDADAALAIAAMQRGFLFVAAGLDPFNVHALGSSFPAALAELDARLVRGCVALGEIGIELHHALDPLPVQCAALEAQLSLAVQRDLPVVIHARSGRFGDAHAEMLAVLRRHPRVRGVIHSFDGSADVAAAYLALGFHLSLNGMVTYKANNLLRTAAASIPADRLLVETDAPYLTPEPHRGRRNEPAEVALVIARLAEIRGEREADVAAWTARNARQLFALSAAS